MTTRLEPQRRIEILVNTMLGEHHARCALAHELCDEVAKVGTLREVLALASQLAGRLERGPMADESYENDVRRIATALQDGGLRPATKRHAS